MGKTKIEWATDVWNPIIGCSIVSPGCTNCYAMAMAHRINQMTLASHYEGTTERAKGGKGPAVWTGKVALANDHILTAPLRWKKPRRIFVNSMGDLFHESVPDEWIDKVFAVMALCPQHTFQCLTKRSKRMQEYMLEKWQGTVAQEFAGITIPAGPPTGRAAQIEEACEPILQQFGLADPEKDDLWTEDGSCKAMQWKWPLANCWLGVSAEDQQRADERIPDLLATPAAVRWVSAEPLIGPIDFTRIRAPGYTDNDKGWTFDCLQTGDYYSLFEDDGRCVTGGDGPYRETKLDWIVVGGESGPGARPMHPDWARQVRDQCKAAGVPFYFKQWGEFGPCELHPPGSAAYSIVLHDGRHLENHNVLDRPGDHTGEIIVRFGKRRAGRLLDGVLHDEYPSP